MRASRAHLTRRRVIVGALALGAALEIAVGAVVLGSGGSAARIPSALPLHPVAGSFEPDDTALEDCDEQACFEQAIGNIAFREGPARALAALEETYSKLADPACHRVAHAIGSASLARNGGDVAKTFAQGSSNCSSGYYHGVLERSLLRVESRGADALARVARGLCTGGDVEASLWLRFQCLHGLGHGLMITTGYTLPLALEVCDRLRTPWEETTCNGGAFMENIATSYGVVSRWLRDDDPVYPCNAVAEEDKLKCYELVTSRIVRVLDGDWEETAQACTEVERSWISACFRSFGRDVAGEAHYEPDAVPPLCALARPHGHESECITSAAESIAGNYRSGLQASELCRAVRDDFRVSCYAGIGSVVVRVVRNPRAGCGAVATRRRDASACVRGGRDYLRFIAGRR